MPCSGYVSIIQRSQVSNLASYRSLERKTIQEGLTEIQKERTKLSHTCHLRAVGFKKIEVRVSLEIFHQKIKSDLKSRPTRRYDKADALEFRNEIRSERTDGGSFERLPQDVAGAGVDRPWIITATSIGWCLPIGQVVVEQC